jgi:hypothetical protein
MAQRTAPPPNAEHKSQGSNSSADHGNGATARPAHVRQAAAGIVESVLRQAPAAGKAAGSIVRHPDAVVEKARKFRLAAPLLRDAVSPLLTGRIDDWHTEFAYSTGLQAFIYGFPYIYNAKLRHDWVTQSRDPSVIPYAAVNHFWHASRLLDATYRDGGCPNTDTLYSVAWLDVSSEPVVLSHPDMGERYFAFELSSFTSDNFDYVGQRTTGTAAGQFAITGPGWEGDLPEGINALEGSPTPWVFVLGRTLVDGPDDIADVRSLQADYRLVPLSLWGKDRATLPERRGVHAPGDAAKDPLAPWSTLNAMLAENPPPAHHKLLLDQFARIGIGPGLDVETQPDAVKRGLMRAAFIGQRLLRAQFLSGDWADVVSGWRYPPPQEGRFGDDYLQRAADQSLAGIVANDPAEAVYLVNLSDADGTPLAPDGRYELRFDASGPPPVDAFWSLSAYTAADMNLIANPADRYSIGDRTTGLIRNPDGGLTIHLQPDSPGADREANWLPTSGKEPWFVILRLYRPRPEALRTGWRCPGLIRTS